MLGSTTLRALTGEVPSSEGAEPVRPTVSCVLSLLPLRGIAMGLEGAVPDGAAEADARDRPPCCDGNWCQHLAHEIA